MANKNAVVYLDEDHISVFESGLHLGVPVGNNSQWMDKRIVKGKRATSAMQTLTPSGAIVNPCISSKLYWAITIPSMLYGIDVWELTDTEVSRFESAHTQMAKTVQGLPVFIADAAVLAILGWTSLQAWIEKRCLLMLLEILSLSMDNIYKKICIERLIRLRGKSNNVVSHGSIALIYKVKKRTQ